MKLKQRNVNSSITSMMLLVLMSYLFNGRMTAVMASGDHQAPFMKSGQQQHQDEDELWEANFMFMANKRDLAARMKKEQLQQQRDESRKLQGVKRLRGRTTKSSKSEAPSISPVPSLEPSDFPSSVPSLSPSELPSSEPTDGPSGYPSVSFSPSKSGKTRA